ncbi:MAG TPA: hypothetical protein PKE39_10005 [Ignavibacteria bacterium]|nr:hypothetical protein [Ignavibacteria bacterium]HMQ99345.1 hypothetical protein [Ignavibacteria bacterium]
MKQKIIENIENPQVLERLYREDKSGFTNEFMGLYPEFKDSPLAQFWQIRLQGEILTEGKEEDLPDTQNITPAGKFDLIYTVIAGLVCGTIFKIPQIFGINAQNFITDNIAFTVLPALALFYLLKFDAERKKYFIIFSVILTGVLYMNLLPWQDGSQTRMLSAIHFLFIMWVLLGAAYVNFDISSRRARMLFLKRNGDTFVLTGVIICAGMLLTMLSVAMFGVIKVRIDNILGDYVVVYGLASAPLVANYMIESSPKIINKVAPFISKLFTPLMLIVMTGFLIALIFFAKDPFNNREELIVFNVLLGANIAVIVFTFSGNSENHKSVYNKILLLLSMEAMIINSIALSAIVYRLFSFGVSPNRIAVLGANLLLFANLILITIKLIQFVRNKAAAENVENGMTVMLPYYAVWAVIVAMLMPVFLWFK